MKRQSTGGVILRPSEITPAARGNGIVTHPLVTPQIGEVGFLNGITIFPPGMALTPHTHNCDESVMLLEGVALVEIDGVITALKQWDTTWVPAGIPHRFINGSDTEAMRIFWTYSAVDATRTNAETGETHTIASEHENT